MKTYGHVNNIKIVAIHDGDTFTADIAGWRPIIGSRIPVRIFGINTKELTSKNPTDLELARKAKQRLVEILRGAKSISLKNMGRDKYFRIVATVIADKIDVGQLLIQENLAQPYLT